MSQYPTGYGQWPNDPSSYYAYAQQSQTATPYTNSPNDPATSANYSATQMSYSHNASQIPGLGTPGVFGGFGVPPGLGQIPYTPPIDHSQHSAWALPQNPHPENIQDPSTQPTGRPHLVNTPKPASRPHHEALEEGELGDEDDDDLYEPQVAFGRVEAPKPVNHAAVVSDKKRAHNHASERSGSYPSHVSSSHTTKTTTVAAKPPSRTPTQPLPGLTVAHDKSEVAQEPGVPHFDSADEARKEAQKSILRLLPLGVKYHNYIDEGFDEEIVKSLFNDLKLLPQPAAPKPVAKTTIENSQMDKPSASTGTTSAKDQTEERKDRIARLLAAKAAIKTAAAANTTNSTPAPAPKPVISSPQVHLSAPPTVEPSPPTVEPSPTRAATSTPIAVRTPTPAATPTAAPVATPTAVPAALPLVAPAAAPTGPAADRNLPPPTAPTGPAALRNGVGAKEKSRMDKEALLKMKLEALKTRQAQAKLLATTATPVSKLPVSNGTSDKDAALPQISRATSQVSAVEASVASLPRSSSPALISQQNVSSPAPNNQPSSSIPGLYLSTSDLGPPQSSRKRPVAADFVDYPSVSASKRPFGQTRQDSFVIEVSEDESDDDIEMEVDSPTGHSPASISRVTTPFRQGPSIKDFPPLSDNVARTPLSRTNSKGPPPELMQLDDRILSMRRKIQELEAKKSKKTSSGSQTPDVANPTPPEFKDTPRHAPGQTQAQAPPRRAVSSSDADGADPASAQLMSEAASAVPSQPTGLAKRGYGQLAAQSGPPALRLPPRPNFGQTQQSQSGPEADRRLRIASFHLPKVEARLLEKRTKLKLLEQKTAQLRIEIENELGEKKKLADELQALESQPTTEAPTTEASQSEHPQPQTVPEASDSRANIHPSQLSAHKEMRAPAVDNASTSQPMRQDTTEPAAVDVNTTVTDSAISSGIETNISEPADTPMADASSADHETPTIQITVPGPTEGSVASAVNEPVAKNHPSSTASDAEDSASPGEVKESSPALPKISDVARPTQDTEEVGHAIREESPGAPKEELPSFTPYESPLRYFRSYRFHPDYEGGLKSLTYTNKINPKQALCPKELTQEQCDDKECRFQHFKTMVPRDDQLLMELGLADDFAEGEEKNKFIAGLRELLSHCRAKKIKDVEQIGRAIIEYRRKFVGDQSRILTSLQGVEI